MSMSECHTQSRGTPISFPGKGDHISLAGGRKMMHRWRAEYMNERFVIKFIIVHTSHCSKDWKLDPRTTLLTQRIRLNAGKLYWFRGYCID